MVACMDVERNKLINNAFIKNLSNQAAVGSAATGTLCLLFILPLHFVRMYIHTYLHTHTHTIYSVSSGC